MKCSRRVSIAVLILAVIDANSWMPRAGRLAQSASRPEGYALEVQTVARVVGVLTVDVTKQDGQQGEWTVFASQAPELPGQTKVKTSLEPAGQPTKDQSELGRDLFVAQASKLPIRITYEATLKSRKLRKASGSRKVADLTPEERETYLADRGYIDFKSPVFTDWSAAHGVQRPRSEGEISFARRVFLGLKGLMRYEARPGRDFHASAVCKDGGSDCGGLSVMFTSIMRANKIPARTLWGRWAHSAEPGKTWAGRAYYQTHVKAEFFARGVGWVPVDMSSAILHDKSPQGLRFFGNDPGDFITFHVDPNLEIDTRSGRIQSIGNLQLPACLMGGKAWLDWKTIVEDWQVKRTKK